MLLNKFPQIDERIAHTTQGCVDGNVCFLGNLAEGEVFVEVHYDYFTLGVRQIGE